MSTVADAIKIVLNQDEIPHFPKEGVCIGSLVSQNNVYPAPIDLFASKGVAFLYDTATFREETNNCLERVAWRMALCLPVGLCSFLIYNGGLPGENFSSMSQLQDALFVSSQSVLFDADADEFTKLLQSVYRDLANRKNVIKSLGKVNISEVEESELVDVRVKYTFIFISDFSKTNQEQKILLSRIVSANPSQSGVFVFMSLDMKALKGNEFDYRALLNQMAILYPKNNRYYFGNTGRDSLLNRFVLKLDGKSIGKEEQSEWTAEINRHIEEASSVSVDIRETELTPLTIWTEKSRYGLKIPIGKISSKELMYFQLINGNDDRVHALIVGTSGSGKSSLLHDIIINGAWLYSPDELQFILVDLKGVEFGIYSRLPHVKVLAGNSGREYGANVLAYVYQEMKRRSDVFTRVGINDIKYYPIDQPPMPRILVVFDEFQVLFEDEGHTGDLRDSDNLSKIKKHLNDILLKGRAYGIHALLVPNNADSIRGIEGFLNYIAVRIALKMPDKGKCLTNDNDVRLDQFEIGEGVYNDNMGAPKDRKGNNRNHFFRSAFYGNLKKEHPSHQEVIVSEMIEPIRKKHVEVYGGETIPKPILFRGGGNSVIADNSSVMTHGDLEKCIVYVGSPITVRRDDVSFIMKPKREYNILIVGANSCYLKSLVQIIFDQIINQSGPHSKCYVCLSKEDDFDLSIYNDKVETHYDKEGLITVLEGLKKHLDDRQKKTESTLDRIVFALMGLRFFTNCIKSDDEVRKNMEEIILNGPENGIHMLLHATKSMDFQNTFSSNDMFFAPTPFNATPAIPPEELKREFGIKIELRGEDRLFSNQYLDDGPPQDDYLANIQTKERIEITKFSIYKQ